MDKKVGTDKDVPTYYETAMPDFMKRVNMRLREQGKAPVKKEQEDDRER